MNHNAPYAAESRLTTSGGEVRLRSFCTPEEIQRHHFDAEFGIHAQFRSLYTHRESLEADAGDPDANVVLALSEADHIVGFAVLAYPDTGERWLDLGPGLMMELRVIEVCRSWRSGTLAHELLGMALDHPRIEDIIAYMVGYSWTWDLDGTGRRAQEYRQILIRLFEAQGFAEYETNEPNICLKQENIFMCRVGRRVPAEVVENFNWLRFGITPEPEATAVAAQGPARAVAGRQSLFYPLVEEGLTFMAIRHHWRNGYFSLCAAATWDDKVAWEDYHHRFTDEHPMTSGARFLGHAQTLELFDRYAVRDYLDDLLEQIRQGRHLGLECYLEPRRDLRVFNFMHSSALDRGHIYHAVRCGAIDCFDRHADESQILTRGLNLSRIASFGNAAAGLPFGGGYIAVQAGPPAPADHASLGFLAHVIDRSRSVVAPGEDFPSEIAEILQRQGFSNSLVGGTEGWDDHQAKISAYGIYLALKALVTARFGRPQLAGRKVVIQGKAAVGMVLMEDYLIPEAAQVYVSGLRPAGDMVMIDAEDVPGFDGDILVYCDGDGILDEKTIPRLKYAIVMGAADSTLRAESREEEIRLARKMARQGIMFQVDWLHNNARAISAVDAYLHSREINTERVMRQVARACRDGARSNFVSAMPDGVTATEHAYAYYDKMVHP